MLALDFGPDLARALRRYINACAANTGTHPLKIAEPRTIEFNATVH